MDFHSLSLEQRRERLRRHIEKEGGVKGEKECRAEGGKEGAGQGRQDSLEGSSSSPSPVHQKKQTRLTRRQSASIQGYIQRHPQARSLILSLPPSLRRDWGELGGGREGGQEGGREGGREGEREGGVSAWKEKHVWVLELAIEMGLSPKQLHAAVRRMMVVKKGRKEGREGGREGGTVGDGTERGTEEEERKGSKSDRRRLTQTSSPKRDVKEGEREGGRKENMM
jgi:hypothetical protein